MAVEHGYATALALHRSRLGAGWRPVGRKIGFTNRSIWPRYGVYEPIWGWVYDRTLIQADDGQAVVPLEELQQPRIEPEICFKLRAAPRSSAVSELLACIDWVVHSVEVVQCDQPGWKTSLEHSTAFNGLHGRLVLGTPVPIRELPDPQSKLPEIELVLRKGDRIVDRGRGEIVLGSPLLALGHLVQLLARQPAGPPLQAGEIVTTGTLTDAHPVAAGELWRTELIGLPLPELALRFA